MDLKRLNQQLNFIVEIDKAKQILRNTVLMDASRKENDAEHSWHMAIAAMILAEYSNDKAIDMLKVFKLSLFHDVVEIDAGDTFVYSNIDSQEISRNERKAAERIYGLLPADQAAELMSIWNEYEDAISPESKFARAIDRFMPILHNYKTKGLQWQKLNVTSDMVLQKNNRIEQGSKELWEYINMIVKDAVEKGYLQK